MIDFVLDDLRSPAGEALDMADHLAILPAHLDVLEAPCFVLSGEAEAAFVCLVAARFLRDYRIEHFHIHAVVVEGDNGFWDADHVGRHADTAFGMCPKRFHEVVSDGDVIRIGGLCLELKNRDIGVDFFDHG